MRPILAVVLLVSFVVLPVTAEEKKGQMDSGIIGGMMERDRMMQEMMGMIQEIMGIMTEISHTPSDAQKMRLEEMMRKMGEMTKKMDEMMERLIMMKGVGEGMGKTGGMECP